ncbi:phosphoenolpyruvate carboxykinase (ATP), partial [Campylobacter coli]|uniref:phosphoenolpyruvate carboxykinase (ATP) n=1 Tax=Campylobacter coli TaxID=195 RepID=UPI00112FC0A9
HAHFVYNMFIRPNVKELDVFKAVFIVYNACNCVNKYYDKIGFNSEVFVFFIIYDIISFIVVTLFGCAMY